MFAWWISSFERVPLRVPSDQSMKTTWCSICTSCLTTMQYIAVVLMLKNIFNVQRRFLLWKVEDWSLELGWKNLKFPHVWRWEQVSPKNRSFSWFEFDWKHRTLTDGESSWPSGTNLNTTSRLMPQNLLVWSQRRRVAVPPPLQVLLPLCVTAEMKNTCDFIPNGMSTLWPSAPHDLPSAMDWSIIDRLHLNSLLAVTRSCRRSTRKLLDVEVGEIIGSIWVEIGDFGLKCHIRWSSGFSACFQSGST